tara:strand:- start:371 stop:772 length:402 start_codon:yes stop_codon:yes gene_type:complete
LSIVNALIGPVSGLLDKFIPDADERAKLAHEIATMGERHAQEAMLAQLEINKAEAQTGSIFIGGWRPAAAWVCVFGMAMNYIITPLANFGLGLAGSEINLPLIDTSTMMPVLLGMLGLAGARSVEKIQRVSKE